MGEGFCSNCGKPVRRADAFCGSCGTKLLSTQLTSASVKPRPRSRSRARVLLGTFVTVLVVAGGLSAGFFIPDTLKPPSGTSGASTTPLDKSTTPIAGSWPAACQALDLADAAEWNQAADGWDHAASEASAKGKAVANAVAAQARFSILAKDALSVARLSSPAEAWKYPASAISSDKYYHIVTNNGPGGQYNQDLSDASSFLAGCGRVDPAFTPPSACNAVQSGQHAQWANATTEWMDAKNQATHDHLGSAASSFDLLATDTTLLAAPDAGADVVTRYHSDLTTAQSYLKGC